MNSNNSTNKNLKIGKRPVLDSIPLFTAIVASVLLVAISFVYLKQIKSKNKSETQQVLGTILDSTHETIHLWIEAFYKRISIVSELDVMSQFAEDLTSIGSNRDELLDSAALTDIREFFVRGRTYYKDIDFFVISPDFRTLASKYNSNIGKLNEMAITNKPLLEKVFSGEVVILPLSDTALPRENKGLSKTKNITMLAVSPVKNKAGQTIAALAIHTDPLEHFYTIAQLGRFGRSGRSYAFDKNGNYITKDNDVCIGTFTSESDQANVSRLVLNAFENSNKHLVGLASNSTDSSKQTLWKKHEHYNRLFIDNEVNSDGEEVLSVWMWDNETQLGYKAQINTKEGLATYYHAQKIIVALLGTSLSLFATIGYLFIWIRRKRYKEIKLHEEYLEEQVNKRTRELQETNKILEEANISKDLYQLLYEYSKDAIVTLYPAGKFIDCNQAALDLFGADNKEIFLEFGPLDLSPEYQPNGQLTKDKEQQVAEEVINNGCSLFEWRHKKLDGTEFTASVLLTSLMIKGELIFQSTVRDITPSKNAMKRIQDQQKTIKGVFDTAPVGILLIDQDIIVRQANKVAAKLLNKTTSDLINKRPGDGIKCIGSKECGCGYGKSCIMCPLRNAIQESLENNKAISGAEAEVVFETDNNKRVSKWFQVNIKPLVLDNQKNVIVIINDITERKHGEQELENSKLEAEAANLAKSQFLANMSHEIRTPLNGVTGMLDLAMDEQLSSKVRNYLHTCKTSADALLNVINDILDISKIEAGKMDFEIIECSINRLLIDIELLMNPKAIEKGIDLLTEFETPVPVTFYCDPTRLRQCLINLIGNAIKFTNEGYVKTRVSMMENNRGKFIKFDVEDTGIGIDKENHKQIFDKFSQADNTITRQFGGTGLGLSITQQLSELLGGELKLKSEKGKGSTFTLLVPVGEKTDTSNLISELDRDEDRIENDAPDKVYTGKILVAEDNIINQKVVKTMLENAGATVTIVENGFQAIQKVSSGKYDMVLMDVHMPIMNGHEATEKLRSKGFNLPVVMLTADVMQKDIEASLAAGANGHLGKPINRKSLFETLDKFMPNKTIQATDRIDELNCQVKELTELAQQNEKTEIDSNALDIENSFAMNLDWSLTIGQFDDDITEEFVNIFLEDAPLFAQKIEEAIGTGNVDEVILHAHSIKGMSAQIGAENLRQSAYNLEMAGKENRTSEFKQLLDDVNAKLEEVMSFLKEENWLEIAKQCYQCQQQNG